MISLLKQKNDDIFCKDNINFSRQSELDVLKVFLVFFMLSCHIYEIFFSNAWEDFYYVKSSEFFQYYSIFVNAITAFGFMFVMGVGMQLSHSHDPHKMFIRGAKLILTWIILKVATIYPLGFLFAESENLSLFQFCIVYVFSSDILFFAGMFVIYCRMMIKFHISDMRFVYITLLLFLSGHFLYFKSDSLLLENLVGLLVMTDDTSFPFLNWIMAPFLGLLWGKILVHCNNKDALYTNIGIISAIVLIVFLKSIDLMGLLTPEWITEYAKVNFFYHSTFLTVLFSTAVFGIFISICYLISRVLSSGPLKAVLYISSRINDIYILQWLIIPWTALILPRPTKQYSPMTGFGIAVVIFAVCLLLIRIYEMYIKREKDHEIK